MTNLIQKIKKLFSKSQKTVNSVDVTENPDFFELSIDWNDICFSRDGKILQNVLKNNGYFGQVTSSTVILDNGSEYIPEQLTEHWEAYNNSPKFKPSLIRYNRLK